MKSFTLVGERVWYISSARKKAKATIDTTLINSQPNIGKRRRNGAPSKNTKTNSDKGPTTASIPAPKGKPAPKIRPKVSRPKHGNPKKPPSAKTPAISTAQPEFIYISVDISESVDEILRLLSLCPNLNWLLGHMDRGTMETIYRTMINPNSFRESDVVKNRLAIELHPDSFGLANTTNQKWLSSDLMNIYGMYLRDTAVFPQYSCTGTFCVLSSHSRQVLFQTSPPPFVLAKVYLQCTGGTALLRIRWETLRTQY